MRNEDDKRRSGNRGVRNSTKRTEGGGKEGRERGKKANIGLKVATAEKKENKDPKQTLKDIEQLLTQHDAGIRLGDEKQGKFALSSGYERAFLKYLPKARVMLRCYTYWLDNVDYQNTERTSKTAVDFYTWAKSRDDLIQERGYKYNRPDIPFAVGEYARQLLASEKPDEDHIRAFKRYLQKAKKLANNAALGTFPGKY